ncbi:hypothetical protein [Oceanobacillus sp. J11TS1]|uniref:hypothetical protein n=1 Tax=Oceanobacillus sp. J11TS1 TaxID=2807191 RepID=UPI001B2A5B8D|nr:hypothetical protein [Oceanobacillus sp. J11TS1]GIO25105.1 hypothetical protein J11TS1_36860 [Oceanobacillus sp. J11TS1]
MKTHEEKELERVAEEYANVHGLTFTEALQQLKRAVTDFWLTLKESLTDSGLIKDYVPPDQMTMQTFLEQKKNHEPFYKSVGKKKPWE